MTSLFSPIKVGNYTLENRIFMAPLTRGRASEKGIPTALMTKYYAQRASAGLIIAEATAISRQGHGWLNSPGLYTDAQQAGWHSVAKSVHNKNGRIFVQLWHMGSTVHPDFLNGERPVSSSEVQQHGALKTPKGPDREFVKPRALDKDEIKLITSDFVLAARRAIDAGLDGVEIHAANGFLIDQFTRDGINKRTDTYGGSTHNRLRFMLEIIEAVCNEIGAGKVGIRLSPSNNVWGISDSNPAETFGRAVEYLNAFDLAYLHILEQKPNLGKVDYLTPLLREVYQGLLVVNSGYTRETGQATLAKQQADAIAYGNLFISNPDLVDRFKRGVSLCKPQAQTFYSGGAKGYIDYPFSKDKHCCPDLYLNY